MATVAVAKEVAVAGMMAAETGMVAAVAMVALELLVVVAEVTDATDAADRERAVRMQSV